MRNIWEAGGQKNLHELTKNPLKVTLLCILCEDFGGVFPASGTQLYIKIVRCVLRRYERKQGLSSKNEDLMSVYKEDLMHLGRLALQSLQKGELCFEEHEFSDNFNVLSKFGFLSVDSSSSKRIAGVRYSFLHKSFQELFSGFYLACHILDGNLTFDSIVTDQRFQDELNKVFLFMFEFVTSTATAESLVKSMAANINFVGGTSDRDISGLFLLALGSIVECPGLAHTLGLHLYLTSLNLCGKRITASGSACLSQAVASISSLTNLDLGLNDIGPSGAASLCKALLGNSSLTNLDLTRNSLNILDAGATSLSRDLAAISSLTSLNLERNGIGDSGDILSLKTLKPTPQ